MKNFRTSLSIYWDLGFERGWIASPGASRSAERRDTSAMVFEDSLQTSHIRHGPEHAMRHGDAKQSTGRKSQSAAIWNPIWNPRWSRCASCNSAAFSSETLAYKMSSLRSIQPQWIIHALPTSHLLTCLGHEHAQKATGPVFWISLPSPCGVPWFPVKTWVKQETNPWLHVPNQNMPKYRIDANTPDPPCSSSRALKRETSEVDFRCSWHKPLLQEDYIYNHIITCECVL